MVAGIRVNCYIVSMLFQTTYIVLVGGMSFSTLQDEARECDCKYSDTIQLDMVCQDLKLSPVGGLGSSEEQRLSSVHSINLPTPSDTLEGHLPRKEKGPILSGVRARTVSVMTLKRTGYI